MEFISSAHAKPLIQSARVTIRGLRFSAQLGVLKVEDRVVDLGEALPAAHNRRLQPFSLENPLLRLFAVRRARFVKSNLLRKLLSQMICSLGRCDSECFLCKLERA
jgi:hypothetical protein